MSVLIKGMEMPKSCWRCPLCLTVDPDTYRCLPTGQEFESTFDAIDHIVLDCPLFEIPPHGDLIDRSQISGLFDRDRHNRNIYSLVWNDAINTVIQTMPTIIDAEEGE